MQDMLLDQICVNGIGLINLSYFLGLRLHSFFLEN